MREVAFLVPAPMLAAQRLLSLAALASSLFLLLKQWCRDVGGDFSSTIVFVLLFTLAPASFYAGSTARGYAFVMLFLTAAYVALRQLAEGRLRFGQLLFRSGRRKFHFLQIAIQMLHTRRIGQVSLRR